MTPHLFLRDVQADDLESLYRFHSDPVAFQQIALLPKERVERERFFAHWREHVTNQPSVVTKAVVVDGVVAGNIVSFERDERREIGYVYGQEFWGRGIATQALTEFLKGYRHRPLYAIAASDNLSSVRVLEKCGFELSLREMVFAEGRGETIERSVLKLS